MEEKGNDVPKQTPVKYDPSKKYKWTPESGFLLSGEEFGAIINALRLTLNSPEGRRILETERAHMAIEKSLSRAVEIGQAFEAEDQPIKKAP